MVTGLILLYFIIDFVKDVRNKSSIEEINAQDDSVIEQENVNVTKADDK